MILPFSSGPPNAVAKFNEIIQLLNSLANVSGDGLIEVNRTAVGYTISLNTNRLLERIPMFGGGGGGDTSVRKAYCKEDAGAATTIICYLDKDVSPTTWIVDTAYTTDSYVTGTDDKTYHSIGNHTSTTNDKPITGANWASYWEIAEIEVECSIAGGGNLNSAMPRLLDGTMILITKIGGIWYCITVFQIAEDCACS